MKIVLHVSLGMLSLTAGFGKDDHPDEQGNGLDL